MKNQYVVAVVGATGVVGRELIRILAERKFPISQLKALASSKSLGDSVEYGDDEIAVQELTDTAFSGVNIAFFAVSGDLAKRYCPIAVKAGAVCIDKSSAFRLEEDVPLVIPEVNPQDIALHTKRGIIASPNCTATPLCQVLAPLHAKVGIKRVVMSSYQSVSGAGQAGVDELNQQVRDLFNFRDVLSPVFQKRIAFNLLPCIPATGPFNDDGDTEEEEKVCLESRKILHLASLPMAITCVRVPVFVGHSESVNIELNRSISADEARDLLGTSKGLMVMDDIKNGVYPTPIDAAGEDSTLVGRIRVDKSLQHGLSLWLTSDNLRTGAALNAVRIAEVLIKEHF